MPVLPQTQNNSLPTQTLQEMTPRAGPSADHLYAIEDIPPWAHTKKRKKSKNNNFFEIFSVLPVRLGLHCLLATLFLFRLLMRLQYGNGFVHLGFQQIRALQHHQQLAVIHLEKHACDLASQFGV